MDFEYSAKTRDLQARLLRFMDDLDVEETARLLGISTGTVKSATSRGLERLHCRGQHLAGGVQHHQLLVGLGGGLDQLKRALLQQERDLASDAEVERVFGRYRRT